MVLIVAPEQVHNVCVIQVVAVQVDPQSDPLAHPVFKDQRVKIPPDPFKRFISDVLRGIAVHKDLNLRLGKQRNKAVHYQAVGKQPDARHAGVRGQQFHHRPEPGMNGRLAAYQENRSRAVRGDKRYRFQEISEADVRFLFVDKFIGKAIGAMKIAPICQHDVGHMFRSFPPLMPDHPDLSGNHPTICGQDWQARRLCR